MLSREHDSASQSLCFVCVASATTHATTIDWHIKKLSAMNLRRTFVPKFIPFVLRRGFENLKTPLANGRRVVTSVLFVMTSGPASPTIDTWPYLG